MSETVYVMVRLKIDECDNVSVADVIDDMEYDFNYYDRDRFDRIVETEIISWNHSGKF